MRLRQGDSRLPSARGMRVYSDGRSCSPSAMRNWVSSSDRVVAPSRRRIRAMWCSTVRGEMKIASPISE